MSKRSNKDTTKAPPANSLQAGAHVAFPDKRANLKRPSQPGKGVGGVRLQIPTENVYTAAQIAQISTLFPAGKEAFARWAADQGIQGQLTQSGWKQHLETFANRAIHGHRRGSR